MSNKKLNTWEWYHVIATIWPKWQQIFVNWEFDTSNPSITTSWTWWTKFNVSFNSVSTWENHLPADHFDWTIDNVRIYNHELSQSEITDLYAEWLTDKAATLPFVYWTEQASSHFNTVTYSGNSSTQSITWVWFQPDLVWIKARNVAYLNRLHDSIRWVWTNKALHSDKTTVEWGNVYQKFVSFDTDWFTVWKVSWSDWQNESPYNYVSWNWKAGWVAVTNTDWSIESQVSANTKAGFSIVSYTGNWADSTVGHGLDKEPELIIAKNRNTAYNWDIYHKNLSWDNTMIFTSATVRDYDVFGTEWNQVTNTTFSVKETFTTNWSDNYIAYAFHSVPGFSKIGSYTGNWLTSKTIDLGFKPAFLMIKRIDTTWHWYMFDNKRSDNNALYANNANMEYDWGTSHYINFNNTWFDFNTVSNNHYGISESWGTFIYYAIAE